ncbi:nucleobase-ascorbate transporter 12 [Prunus yedoensis var. nudiflora]|uniref:Nucleobase-ascorbate transporter 12 n=1 Tax=Prunus yedoensis var. nudiflora TaxID=2094558 RepID=A0A314XSE7_PRUYE|nr:nucleobase-ascorbate transporter 12 [Prunus yedoensis var. nudiflora]
MASHSRFRPKFSSETNGTDSSQISLLLPRSRELEAHPDLEARQVRPQPALNGVPEHEVVASKWAAPRIRDGVRLGWLRDFRSMGREGGWG